MTALRPPAPTLEQVAAAAGVSRSTASRVINGSPLASAAVVAAVNDAIVALNYQPNRAARSLANRQTMAIALVVPEETTRFFGDPYFAAVVDGIVRALNESDYVLNLQLAGPDSYLKSAQYLNGGNVDGALVVSHHSGDAFLDSLDGNLPLVFNGQPQDPEAYYVDVDNVAAAAAGTQHLIDLGRRRIATIAGPADMVAGIGRASGWSSALTSAGLPADRIAYGDFSLASGSRAMQELLDAGGEIDGLFVASDLMAMGAMSVIRERGLKVPDDIAVVGFDDSPAAVSSDIALTTVRQPATEMGAKMARMLLELLRGERPARACVMPTSVVVRESA